MNRDDIIRMAREAGFADDKGVVHAAYQLESFAALVAAAAMKREHQWMTGVLGKFSITNETLIFIRETIKARGENENT
jgi:hypothetical protein